MIQQQNRISSVSSKQRNANRTASQKSPARRVFGPFCNCTLYQPALLKVFKPK